MAVPLPNAINEHLFVSDEGKLLGIFPLEVWQMILNELEEPQDLTNCSNASPFFRKLLLPKRTVFLFPEVLKIMLANDGLDVINPLDIDDAERNFESLEETWNGMKSQWDEFDEGAAIIVYCGDQEEEEASNHSESESHSDDNVSGEQDNGQAWELMKEGWSDIELAWNDLYDTFDNIRHDDQMATFGWNRKVELWDEGIVNGWTGMHEVWEGTKDINECRESVNIVRNNWIKIQNITICTNEWIDAIPNMRLAGPQWSNAIRQILGTGNLVDEFDIEDSGSNSSDDESDGSYE